MLELAAELGIPAKAGTLSAEALRQADEVFFTSTAGGVMPVGALDGRLLGPAGRARRRSS